MLCSFCWSFKENICFNNSLYPTYTALCDDSFTLLWLLSILEKWIQKKPNRFSLWCMAHHFLHTSTPWMFEKLDHLLIANDLTFTKPPFLLFLVSCLAHSSLSHLSLPGHSEFNSHLNLFWCITKLSESFKWLAVYAFLLCDHAWNIGLNWSNELAFSGLISHLTQSA